MMGNLLVKLNEGRVLWSQCWDPRVCLPWPLNNVCAGAHICIAVIQDGTTFKLRVQLDSLVHEFTLTNGCIPAMTVSVGELDVCISDVHIGPGVKVSFTIDVKICLNLRVKKICVNVFSHPVDIGFVKADVYADVLGLTGDHKAHFLAANSALDMIPVADDGTLYETHKCNCQGG